MERTITRTWYDNNGNLLTKTQISNGQVSYYTWDYRNRLTSVVVKNAQGTVLSTSQYTYDPLNNRIGVSVNTGSGAVQTWTAYDGTNPYADFNSSGQTTHRYLYSPAVDAVLADVSTSGSGSTSWELADELGSVRDVANVQGTVIDHDQYDPFGNLISESNPSNGDRFKYAEQQADATGLSYDRARYYNPATGRFISQDPAGFGGGDVNLYRYVGNDPTAMTDPTGEMAYVPPGPVGNPWAVSGGAYYYTPAASAPPPAETVLGGIGQGLMQGVWNTGQAIQNMAIGMANAGPLVVNGYVTGVNAATGWTVPKIQYIPSPQWSIGSWCNENPTLHIVSVGSAEVGLTAAVMALEAAGAAKAAQEAEQLCESGACFAAGTRLRTPAGSKRIEEFNVGDMLLSAPEHDGEATVETRRVTQLFKSYARILTVRVGDWTIRTTKGHPFYVRGKGWTKAELLSRGDLLRSHDGRCTPVENVDLTVEDTTVYNLRIGEFHTYFVGDPSWGFSVWRIILAFARASSGVPVSRSTKVN